MGAPSSIARLAQDAPSREEPCRPSLDNPRFEAWLLRLHLAIDVEGFWAAVQSILNATIPNDGCAAHLDYVDFANTAHARRILATPNAPRSRQWLQHRREASLMPACVLANPGVKLLRLSEGWCHTAWALFWDGQRLVSAVVIRRNGAQGDFTAHELALLGRLHPHIEITLHRLAALETRAAVIAVPNAADAAADAQPVMETLNALTVAERELVRFVRAGWSNKEIAVHLEKSVRTVKTQLTSVYKKCGVRSRSRLLAMLIGRTASTIAVPSV